MTYDLTIKVQTHADLTAWETGRKLLSGLFSNAKLAPQRVSTFGGVVDVTDIESCQPLWALKAAIRSNGSLYEFKQSFDWKRRKVIKSEGSIWFSRPNIYGEPTRGGIVFWSPYRKDIDWRSLFKGWCVTTQAYAGILHPYPPQDAAPKINKSLLDYTFDEDRLQNAWSHFKCGTLHVSFRAGELNSLVTGLTNLGWATWFGGDLAKEVDEPAIAAAGFPIQKLEGGYLVQVTGDINDALDDFPMFSKKRAELKSLFRNDLFLIKDEPALTPDELPQRHGG